MGKIIYADHSATTYVKDEVLKEIANIPAKIS